MYNVFKFDKLENESNFKKISISKEKTNKIKKQKNSNYVKNYQERIKNFVFEMAQKPILINDYKNALSNVREEFDKENKIYKKKDFIFSTFMTEKQRLKEYLDKKNTIYSNHNIMQLIPQTSINKPKKTFVQPKMRFKARTDLERIYDEINRYCFGRADRNIIMKQLKDMQLNTAEKNLNEEKHDHSRINQKKIESKLAIQKLIKVQKVALIDQRALKDLNDSELDYNINQIDASQRTEGDYHERKKSIDNSVLLAKRGKRKFVDNSGAKALMSEYHNKTHFKAASDLAMFSGADKSQVFNNSLKNIQGNSRASRGTQDICQMNATKSSSFKKFSIDSKNVSKLRNRKELDSNSSVGQSDFKPKNLSEEYLERLLTDDLDLELIRNNPFFHAAYNNKQNKTEIQKETLDKLKNLSEFEYLPDIEELRKNNIYNFKNSDRNSAYIPSKIKFEKTQINLGEETMDREAIMKKEEEKVTIGGEEIDKKYLNRIAMKVLKNCNFIHDKNPKYNSNHYFGDGMMSMTGGLKIKDFMKKYNLK